MMKEKDYNLDGFYTEEVQGRTGRRVGFDTVLVNNPGEKSTLARIKLVLFCNYKKFNLT